MQVQEKNENYKKLIMDEIKINQDIKQQMRSLNMIFKKPIKIVK